MGIKTSKTIIPFLRSKRKQKINKPRKTIQNATTEGGDQKRK